MFRKTTYSFILISVFSASVLAQSKIDYLKEYGDRLNLAPKLADSKNGAKDAMENIVRYTGLTPNFQIIEDPGISTAIAYNRQKQRYIAYNPKFMLRVKDRTKSDWGAISVLAHEIGHHLSGHTLIKKKRDPKQELEADRFSGFILYKMGATLEEAKSVINLVDLHSKPETHPPKTERLIAITLGWLDANKLEENFFSSDTATDQILPISSTELEKTRKKPYVYKCIIFGDKNYYFVDEKNQVISIDDYGQSYVVGYKVKSNDQVFDWIFSVQGLSHGVDSKGKMWSKTYAGDMIIVGKVYNIGH